MPAAPAGSACGSFCIHRAPSRFRITPTQALKIANRVSNLLILTESGKTGTLVPGEPVYIVGSSIRPGGSGDLKAFSEARARQTEQIRDLENLSGREIAIGGSRPTSSWRMRRT